MSSENNFLQSIAQYYFQKLQTDFTSICFVFPGRRAGIFFHHYLKELAHTPLFAPKTITINELFRQQSTLSVADSITLLFELHRVFQHHSDQATPFDEFLPWAEMFLNDFEDIDKYLADPRQLFRNVADLKELDDDYSHLSDNQRKAVDSFWGSFYLEKKSSHKQNFIETWEKLYPIYLAYRSGLREKKMAYSGMIYRDVAEAIVQNQWEAPSTLHYVFVGFNALTAAEIILLKHLKKKGLADFFWDYSPLMRSNQDGLQSVAGRFLRENLILFPAPADYELPVQHQWPACTFTAVAHPSEQGTEVADFLSNPSRYGTAAPDSAPYNGVNERTAVILTDENMLLPVLYAIPESVNLINVTMGYPLKSSPAYGLIDLLYKLQKNARAGADGNWFYHRTVLPLLQHPYVVQTLGEEAHELRAQIVAQNQIFIPSKALGNHPLCALVFQRLTNTLDMTEYLRQILASLGESFDPALAVNLNREFLHVLGKALNRFAEILEQQTNLTLQLETWFRLFRKIAEIQTVSFQGEPLAGLQIMGILETRAVDFDRLLILDMNEGVFPKTSANLTFIPHQLRVAYQLPTLEYQDSIFAYYFFRLIHRAKQVDLVYSTSSAGGKSGEMSRFLYQLQYEWQLDVTKRTSVQPVEILSFPALEAHKTPSIQEKLNDYTTGKSFLSPSALSQYLKCPLLFYYQKIWGIQETEEVNEEADARIFGNIFHRVLEKYYQPHIQKTITPSLVNQWIEETDQLQRVIRKTFEEELGLKAQEPLQGNNLLVSEVIFKYVTEFLKHERAQAPFTFENAEYKFKMALPLNSDCTVWMGGTIDRLHEKEGVLHLIDYKTGDEELSFASVDDLFDPMKHGKVKAIFQTVLYAYLLKQQGESRPIQPGISLMKNLFNAEFSTQITQKFGRENDPIMVKALFPAIEQHLHALLKELLNPEIPFRQTLQPDNCRICSCKAICNK